MLHRYDAEVKAEPAPVPPPEKMESKEVQEKVLEEGEEQRPEESSKEPEGLADCGGGKTSLAVPFLSALSQCRKDSAVRLLLLPHHVFLTTSSSPPGHAFPPTPLSDTAKTFLCALGSSSEEEVGLELQERMQFSKEAVGRMVCAFDRLHQRIESLCARVQAVGNSTPWALIPVTTGYPLHAGLCYSELPHCTSVVTFSKLCCPLTLLSSAM